MWVLLTAPKKNKKKKQFKFTNTFSVVDLSLNSLTELVRELFVLIPSNGNCCSPTAGGI